MLQSHYRSPFDYSPERLEEAKHALERIEGALRNWRWELEQCEYYDAECPANKRGGDEPLSSVEDAAAIDVRGRQGTATPTDAAGLQSKAAATRERFVQTMDDDFNTAGAIAAIYELISAGNSSLTSGIIDAGHAVELQQAIATIIELLEVLGIELELDAASEQALPIELVELAARLAGYHGDIPEQASDVLMEARARARSNKDWALADAIRDGLAELGYQIEDTPSGTRVVLK
jgi:cysteinyl-tRNA synthetase